MILSLLTGINTILAFKFLSTKISGSLFLKFITFVTTLLTSYYQIKIFKKLIEKFTKIEFLNEQDQNVACSYYKKKFFGKSDNSIHENVNLFGLFTLDGRINSEDIINQLKSNIFKHKFYEKLKKVPNYSLLMFYWKYSNEFNINNHFEIFKTSLKTQHEISEFLKTRAIQKIFQNEEIPQWKFIIIENMENNNSGIALIISHVYADGIGVMSFLQNVCEVSNWEVVKMPRLKPTFTKKLLLQLMIPLAVLFQPLQLLLALALNIKYKNNPIVKSERTNKINYFYTKNYDLKKLKQFKNQEKVSLNDVITYVYIRAFQKYFSLHKAVIKNPKQMGFVQMVSMRKIPAQNEFIQLKNKFCVAVQEPMLFDDQYNDLKITPQQINKQFNLQKNMFYFIHYMIKTAAMLMPAKLYTKYVKFQNKPFSAILTGIPGPTTEGSIFGKKLSNVNLFIVIEMPVNVILVSQTFGDKFNVQIFSEAQLPFTAEEFSLQIDDVLNKEIFTKN